MWTVELALVVEQILCCAKYGDDDGDDWNGGDRFCVSVESKKKSWGVVMRVRHGLRRRRERKN